MACSYGELSKHSTNVLNVSKGPSNVVLYESVNEVGSVLIKPSLNVITLEDYYDNYFISSTDCSITRITLSYRCCWRVGVFPVSV